MKEYRIILAEENPREYNDAEKIVADGLKKPSFADVRHMVEFISVNAVMDDVVYNGVFQLFQCISEAVRRAKLAREEFPIRLLYRDTQCVVVKPWEGIAYSTAWASTKNINGVIETALKTFQ